MISVVTVPHTGTIYTLDLLRTWGVDVERKHLENLDAPPYGNERFGPGFPCPSSDEWAAYPDDRRIVCTLRDPVLAVISSLNRRLPDRMISVDGWAVMAAWWEDPRPLDVHFFPIPPTRKGLVDLARFAGASMGWMHTADMTPKNTSDDPRGIRRAYLEEGIIEHPILKRAVDQLAEMPKVENLFADHGFDLPWFAHSRDERDEANHLNSLDPRELS